MHDRHDTPPAESAARAASEVHQSLMHWIDLDGVEPAGAAALEHLALQFMLHGHQPYEGRRREDVNALEHALQCAHLAELAGAAPALVAAALLHDIGHFEIALDDQVDDRHEDLAADWLAPVFGAAVADPVRLHVAAKRYLVAVDDHYAERLSPASVHSLALQGGAFDRDEIAHFESLPGAQDAVQLRRWDEAAKMTGRLTPPLAHYLGVLADLLRQQAPRLSLA
ncbi:HD domain-containing protein [Leptothrix discophora]|uniref:Phosphohydrolase n=1 Tax=Leptothrix discophora TaxID=89 RepID=A0ABT9G6I4_LEPDI|nr:HD domain-containing protein [Leptothrix discophora]MDP4302094.1 phosphohydrolase [Leptothrix discophora]